MTANAIKRAIFLDRDGTLSPDEFGYIKDPAGYSLYPFTGEALSILQAAGYLLFLVTNQSGIARGYLNLDELNSVHARLNSLLEAERVRLDRIYFSPYYVDGIVEPYNIDHEDRKPGLGLFKQAKRDYKFDPSVSWMIGDRYTDVAFGKKAGLKTILLLTGNGREIFYQGIEAWEYKPDFVVDDLLTAAKLISEFYAN